MRFHRRIETVLTAIVLGLAFSGLAAADDGKDELVFIVAADMRSAATGAFSGVCEAIKAAGPGAFMISPGDLDSDPPSAVRNLINEVLGEEYPWYPVVGNHEPESPSTMRYIRQYSTTLPNLVNRGPEGCEATTYSFEWADVHFVVLNQYYDGTNDWGVEGEVVPELLEWLEEDLAATEKKNIFVLK